MAKALNNGGGGELAKCKKFKYRTSAVNMSCWNCYDAH